MENFKDWFNNNYQSAIQPTDKFCKLVELYKKESLEQTLNHCLNDALCNSKRIKGAPDSNKIAEFISKWLENKEKV